MRWLRTIFAVGLSAMLSAGGAASAASDDTAALKALRTEVIALLKKARPATKPSEGSDPWLIVLSSGTLSIVNLARNLEELEGAARRAEILRFADAALPTGPAKAHASFASVEKRLRIQIAPAEYGAANSPMRALHRDFGEGLIVAYVVDYPDRIEYVREERAKEWKVDRDTIERAAIANLEGRLRSEPIEVEQVKSGIGRHMIVVDGDGFGAARVLCPNYMMRLHEKLGPHLFIGIPTRDELIAWAPGHASRKKLVELVELTHRTRSHPLTPTVFVTDRGRLRPAGASELAD